MIFNNSMFEYLTYTYYTRTLLHYSICHSFEIEMLIWSNWPKQSRTFYLFSGRLSQYIFFPIAMIFPFVSYPLFTRAEDHLQINLSQLSLLLLLSVSPWLQDSSLISTYCSYEAKLNVLEKLVHAFFVRLNFRDHKSTAYSHGL